MSVTTALVPAASPAPARLAVAAVVAQTVVLQLLFVASFGVLADDDPFSGDLRDIVTVVGVHLVDAAVVIGLVLLAVGRRTAAELGWSADPRPARSALLGLAGAAAAISLVVAASGLVGGVEAVRETVAGFVDLSLGQRVLMTSIGVGAALIEETVFRGTLQPVLVARLGRPAGVAATAVIFSAYHLKFGLVGFVVKALFGGIFGALRETTGRNWSPALAHALVWVVVGLS